ncbi:DUF2243 domain-containing protein [Microvirga roseola]|uniref:DUF2243 domain-containing protein n=1 Tax=Microvirga roseola TaxID=2883126 RepID=UPI001E459738|nr:DUF2243 domain-containing protein [Microvirga roseola]
MAAAETRHRARWSGYCLGFALGGFFDGILLHQILQWHHLLSAINSDDVRFQVAADGYFHAAMYVIAGLGLWMLAISRHVSPRLLAACILIGFGAWHVADSFLSHWLLGIHRIRMDSGNPLFWDLLWFAVFGLAPWLLGWLMLRRIDRHGDGIRRSATKAQALAALLTFAAGFQAMQPQEDGLTAVLFASGTGPAGAMRAVSSAGGQVVWTDPSGELVVIRLADGMSGWRLFREGAILVSGAGLPPGCFNYLRT